MSRIRRRFEIIERSPSHYLKQTPTTLKPPRTLMTNPCFPSFPVFEEELDCTLDLLNLAPSPPSSLDYFDTITDLIQIVETPFRASTRPATRRVGLTDLYLQTLVDRVSDLEMGFDRLVREEKIRREKKFGERKYTWTAEVKIPENDRKYRWTAEIKDWKDEKKGLEKSNKLTTEIKRKGAENFPIKQTYTIKVCSGEEKKKKKQCEKVKGNGQTVGSTARTIEIEEPHDDGGIVLKQVFDKRVERRRGKRKELSPQDAAALIQNSFRAYLTRRSQALRALRDLAIAKTKLKEIRALFNNFSYRRRIASDAVEHQRFSEKIIVLLLTVDAIEGADLMVRGAKRSMVDELEAMLDVVDPQKPIGKSLSMRRRTFDMPVGVNKELAAGVEQVVQMLEREADGSESFEACL